MDKPSSHTSSNTMTALFPHPSFNGGPTVSSMAPSAPTSSSSTSLVSAPVESRVAPSFASLPLSSEVVSSVSSSFGLSPQSQSLDASGTAHHKSSSGTRVILVSRVHSVLSILLKMCQMQMILLSLTTPSSTTGRLFNYVGLLKMSARVYPVLFRYK
jgi:hypothetical protein